MQRVRRRGLRSGISRWWGGLLACAALLLLAGCGEDAYRRVVIVSVSSLRWDHLGQNGYPRPTTPFLDEMAERGAVFARAYAPSSRTTSSHATLLSGLEPPQHGVLSDDAVLPADIPTLAERLASRGFTGGAFVATHAHWEPRGLSRGFEHFDAPLALTQDPYRPADRVVDAALDWIGEQGASKPLFVLVHLHDPSRPYHPPPAAADAVIGDMSPDYYRFLEERQGVPLGWYRWEYRKLNRVFNNYDGEVRFVDDAVRRLVGGLEERGLWKGTLLIVTSPHGAGLGNHFWDTHDRVLYEEEVHVPLLMYAGDGSIAARRIPDVVALSDVLPTVLDLLGGESALAGLEPAPAGRSLVPLLRGETLAVRPAFLDRGAFPPLTHKEEQMLARSPLPPKPGPLLGLVGPRWKYLHYAEADDELYDLENDPLELNDLLVGGAAPPAEAAGLEQALTERAEALGAGD